MILKELVSYSTILAMEPKESMSKSLFHEEEQAHNECTWYDAYSSITSTIAYLPTHDDIKSITCCRVSVIIFVVTPVRSVKILGPANIFDDIVPTSHPIGGLENSPPISNTHNREHCMVLKIATYSLQCN